VRQVIDQTIVELALQQIIEQSHSRPRVGVQKTLRQLRVPMLFSVAQGIDGTQCARLIVGEPEVLPPEVHTFPETDRSAKLLAKDRNAGLCLRFASARSPRRAW
jgi:hypothetical protein